MQVLIIGAGAIGSALAREAARLEHDVAIADMDPARASALADTVSGRHAKDISVALADAALVIEAASGDAVRTWAVPALRAGCDVLIMSVGAFADDAFLDRVRDAARLHQRRVLVPSGAMAGIDAVKALSTEPRATCTLTTRKPPGSLGVEAAERRVLFEGDFREAVARFPKNVNVAAALALGGIPPTVRVVADPAVTRNTHEVVVSTDRHRIEVVISSDPSVDNPATSDLAVRSAIASLRGLDDPFHVGT